MSVIMDRHQVLKTSTSLLNVLGASKDMQDWVQKQMASLLGVQDPNFYQEVEKLWQEAYKLKITYEKYDHEIFRKEAVVKGLKGVRDGSLEVETEKLETLRQKRAEIKQQYDEVSKNAKEAQEEYFKNRF